MYAEFRHTNVPKFHQQYFFDITVSNPIFVKKMENNYVLPSFEILNIRLTRNIEIKVQT
jgi:hypothetical protein